MRTHHKVQEAFCERTDLLFEIDDTQGPRAAQRIEAVRNSIERNRQNR